MLVPKMSLILVIFLQIKEELTALGVETSAIEGILAATSLGSVEELQQLLGNDNEAVQVRTSDSCRTLFQICIRLKLCLASQILSRGYWGGSCEARCKAYPSFSAGTGLSEME